MLTGESNLSSYSSDDESGRPESIGRCGWMYKRIFHCFTHYEGSKVNCHTIFFFRRNFLAELTFIFLSVYRLCGRIGTVPPFQWYVDVEKPEDVTIAMENIGLNDGRSEGLSFSLQSEQYYNN